MLSRHTATGGQRRAITPQRKRKEVLAHPPAVRLCSHLLSRQPFSQHSLLSHINHPVFLDMPGGYALAETVAHNVIAQSHTA